MAVHESLSQRLVVRHHLTGLDRDELDHYLTHRLRLAGCEVPGCGETGCSTAHSARDRPRRPERLRRSPPSQDAPPARRPDRARRPTTAPWSASSWPTPRIHASSVSTSRRSPGVSKGVSMETRGFAMLRTARRTPRRRSRNSGERSSRMRGSWRKERAELAIRFRRATWRSRGFQATQRGVGRCNSAAAQWRRRGFRPRKQTRNTSEINQHKS